MIKTLIGALFILTMFANVDARGQEAKVEEVTIYNTIKGKIYLNETFFVNVAGAPVQITSVDARHIPSETAQVADLTRDQLYKYLSDDDKKRIRSLSSENLKIEIGATGERAVAVKFGVIAYDAFKEFLGGLTAVTMSPPEKPMTWNFSPAYLFKFEKYGVVGVYVRQARLSDGTIWNYSPDRIQSEFSKTFSAITKEQIISADE